MSNSYISGCGATVEIMEGCEARFDLRLGIEEIKIVIMGLKKRQKKLKQKQPKTSFSLRLMSYKNYLITYQKKHLGREK